MTPRLNKLRQPIKSSLFVLIVTVLLSGCAAQRLHSSGINLIDAGHEEEGIVKLAQATRAEPENLHYKAEYINRLGNICNKLFSEATQEHGSGHLQKAEQLYQKILRIKPGHERAQDGLLTLARDQRHTVLIEEAQALLEKFDPEQALEKLQTVLKENPEHRKMLELKQAAEEQLHVPSDALSLDTSRQKPITLEFKEASVKAVFDAITRASGVRFEIDKDVRPDLRLSVQARQSSLSNLLDSILGSNQLEKKILSPNSVLIYPNTPDKIKSYQDLMVRAFYLANADAKETLNMVKTLLKVRDAYVDERLNMMVVRDTPDAIRLVEKLISLQDINDPEVMLEVEVLEVTRSKLTDLGISVPNQLTLTPVVTTLNSLRQLNDNKINAGIGPVIANLRKEDGNVNLLANPRIRTKNREKSKILIGDKLPVITTTSSSTGFISESVQYLDVGLKLDVEPTISLRDDVTIKLNLEVSSIVQQIKSASGTVTYQIGTRNASTVLKLKDGETQVLAGLINDEDRSTASRIPGLGDLPILGRLFSSQQDNLRKTEVILSITPHLIRGLQRPTAPKQKFWSGTEATLRDVVATIPAKAGKDSDAALGDMNASPNKEVSKKNKGILLTWDVPEKTHVGETFNATLKIQSGSALHGLPFEVLFNPAQLQLLDVKEGAFFKQQNALTNFTQNVDSSKGKASIGIMRAGAVGAIGMDTVATFTFKAITASAKSELRIANAMPVSNNVDQPSVVVPPEQDIVIDEK